MVLQKTTSKMILHPIEKLLTQMKVPCMVVARGRERDWEAALAPPKSLPIPGLCRALFALRALLARH